MVQFALTTLLIGIKGGYQSMPC